MIKTKIEWCDYTVNLWIGCSKVHTGCKNCYAENHANRFYNNVWGKNSKRYRVVSAFSKLDKLQKRADKLDTKFTVFVGSLMDIFEEDMPLQNQGAIFSKTSDLREYLFDRIKEDYYPNLIFLFLTKRTNHDFDIIYASNVWYGISISNQKTAEDLMLDFEIMAYNGYENLFLSIEPQIGGIKNIDLTYIRWVIQGGESGHKRRPFKLKWAKQMRKICQKQNVPYFFKQIDKKQAIPKKLLIREFPKF